MKVNINKLKNEGSTPKLKQSLIERPKQDKKVIPIKQQGGDLIPKGQQTNTF